MSIALKLGEARGQVFKAAAVVVVCRHAVVSEIEGLDPDQLADALEVVGELLRDVAGKLEQLCEADPNYQPGPPRG